MTPMSEWLQFGEYRVNPDHVQAVNLHYAAPQQEGTRVALWLSGNPMPIHNRPPDLELRGQEAQTIRQRGMSTTGGTTFVNPSPRGAGELATAGGATRGKR